PVSVRPHVMPASHHALQHTKMVSTTEVVACHTEGSFSATFLQDVYNKGCPLSELIRRKYQSNFAFSRVTPYVASLGIDHYFFGRASSRDSCCLAASK